MNIGSSALYMTFLGLLAAYLSIETRFSTVENGI